MKRYLSFLLCLCVIFMLYETIGAQQENPYSDEIEMFEQFVREQMTIDQIPGLSIGFMKDDFIWAKGYGYADLENKTPATKNSGYRLASNTKSMTAVAILQLVENGKIDLDDRVRKYVPYFPRKKWPITVRQLLGHLGGISHYKNYDVEGHIKVHKDTREAIDIFDDFQLVAEPGTEYNYTSYGYNLLGAVIEGASRQPYGKFLRKNLWEPLEMNDTYMDDPMKLIPNRVQGYRLIFGEIKNSEFVDISSRFAAGGTRSTVIDLLKYAKGLQETTVLSPKSIQMMETSMSTDDGRFIDYGMGWVIRPVNGHFMAYHTGGQPETRTLLVRFPTMNFAIALAYNLEGANLHAYSHRLYQLLMDEFWNVPVYTGNQESDAMYKGLSDVFNFGMSQYDRYGKPLTTENQELNDAFSYVNRCIHPDSLQANFKRINQRIQDGRHPVADQAFVTVGSFMTSKLKDKYGDDRFDRYHTIGPLSFFNDYITMYKSDSDLPSAYRFNLQLEKLIREWHQDWKNIWTDDIRQLNIAAYSDPDQIGKRLQKLFDGEKIYPDFTSHFSDAVTDLAFSDRLDEALDVAKRMKSLYPQSAEPSMVLGTVYVMMGELDKAKAHYQEAQDATVDRRYANSMQLNRYAYEMFRMNRLEKALSLLSIGKELYPDEARFYDTIGDIYLEKSRRSYQKSLDLDPTLENPWEQLKEIDE